MARSPIASRTHAGRVAGAVVLLAVLVPASGCIAYLYKSRGLDRAAFEKIELDMTEEEVQELVGKPDARRKMNTFGAPTGNPEIDDMARNVDQFMYAYSSGFEFAQVYFEDGRVFGVRFNNEFLKGDWVGEEMPESLVEEPRRGGSGGE